MKTPVPSERCSLSALVGGTVYLGEGRVIDPGYVIFRGARIEEVGALSAFTRNPDIEVLEVEGKLVLPGLVDSHLHLVGYAKSLVEPNLADTRSLDEGLEIIRSRVARMPKGAWLTGRGWDKQRWGLTEFPTRWALDSVAPDNPVSLRSRDGHLVWVNSAALSEAGLAEKALRVEGGEMAVDGSGCPTGILKENAANLLELRTDRAETWILDAVRQACEKLVGFGLTGVHTIEGAADARVLTGAVEAGCVPLNLFRMREVLEPDEIDPLEPSSEIACIKTYADGALGSQTASMLEPYCSQPANSGIAVASRQKLLDIVLRALAKGFAVAVHAIGDRANRDILDVYEEVKRNGRYGDALLRVEHAQVLRPEDMPRFGHLGVIASMQPVHLLSDRAVTEHYWGARSGNAYAWKRIITGGGRVAFGSDAPIESPDPLWGIHAAATRCDPAEPDLGPWCSAERLEVWQAIDCYTAGGAAARGALPEGGRIEVGARSDFTILDRNVLASREPDSILDTRVICTIIGGQVLFYA